MRARCVLLPSHVLEWSSSAEAQSAKKVRQLSQKRAVRPSGQRVSIIALTEWARRCGSESGGSSFVCTTLAWRHMSSVELAVKPHSRGQEAAASVLEVPTRRCLGRSSPFSASEPRCRLAREPRLLLLEGRSLKPDKVGDRASVSARMVAAGVPSAMTLSGDTTAAGVTVGVTEGVAEGAASVECTGPRVGAAVADRELGTGCRPGGCRRCGCGCGCVCACV